MPNNKTRQLAHGAMMVAIFAVLIAIAYYIPVISYIAVLIAPLPMAWYSANYERSSSILTMVVAVLITFFIGGLLILPVSIIFAVMGACIGDALRNKKSKLYLLISTSLALLVTSVAQYFISLKLLEFDIINDSIKLLRDSYEDMIKTTEKITGETPISTEQLDLLFDTMNTVIPAAIALSVVAVAFIIISVNLPLLRRFKVVVPKFEKFKNMQLPKAVLWYYLVVLVITLFIKPETGTTLYVITLNFSLVFWILLALQGLSLMFYLIEDYNLPKYLKGLAVILAIPFYSFLLLLGILDLGFNIRTFIEGKMKK